MFNKLMVICTGLVLSLSGCSQENGSVSAQESKTNPEAYSFEKIGENQGILHISMNEFQSIQGELDATIQESGRTASIKAEPAESGVLLTLEGNLTELFAETVNPKEELSKTAALGKDDYCIYYWLWSAPAVNRHIGFQAYTWAKALTVYSMFLTTPNLGHADLEKEKCPS